MLLLRSVSTDYEYLLMLGLQASLAKILDWTAPSAVLLGEEQRYLFFLLVFYYLVAH